MTASTVRSAQIIRHPRAAAEPVLQQKRKGRYPKVVVPMYELQFLRNIKFRDPENAALIASEVAGIEGQIERMRVVMQKIESDWFARLDELTKANMTSKERYVLANSIRNERELRSV